MITKDFSHISSEMARVAKYRKSHNDQYLRHIIIEQLQTLLTQTTATNFSTQERQELRNVTI